MANRLYEETMNQGTNVQFNSFMQNPAMFLMQRGLNVPIQYMNNPQNIIQYMLNTGQMSQEQLNVLRQRAAMMGVNV